MKAWMILFSLFLSLSAFGGEIEVKVNGMVCSLCAQGIQKKFKGHSEVKNVDVNLDTKVVKIQTQDGKDLNDEVVTKIIKEAGYNVAKIERK